MAALDCSARAPSGVSIPLTFSTAFGLTFPEKSKTGSIIMRSGFRCSTSKARSALPCSVERSRGSCRRKIRERSAPNLSNRGLKVSEAPSSHESIRVFPFSPFREPSGHGFPMESLAAISNDSQVLPQPGSPLSRLSLAHGK